MNTAEAVTIQQTNNESSPPWNNHPRIQQSKKDLKERLFMEGWGCWFVWEAQTLKKAAHQESIEQGFLSLALFSMMNVIKCTDYKGAWHPIAFAAFPELITTISRMAEVVKAIYDHKKSNEGVEHAQIYSMIWAWFPFKWCLHWAARAQSSALPFYAA